MNPPIRVALVLVSLDSNVGPARALLALATRLDRRRFAPHLITFHAPGLAAAKAVAALHDVPFASLDTPRVFDVRGLWRLARVLRRWRIDVVHARLQRPGFYARVAALAAGRPAVVVNVSNMYGNHFRAEHGAGLGRSMFVLEKASTALVDRWVANSHAVARDLERTAGVRSEAIEVIHNAVDVGEFQHSVADRLSARASLGIAADAWVVGCVSRLVPLKRLDVLIEGAALAGAGRRRPTLLMVGDGPERIGLEQLASRLGVAAIFVGERGDVARLLPAFDVFAFPSSSEGQPNSVLEAMAAGLPVIVSDIPGMDELVEQGHGGLRVELTPPAFAAAFDRLAADPAAAASMGEAGLRRALTAFSPERMVTAFEHLYERVARAREHRRSPAPALT